MISTWDPSALFLTIQLHVNLHLSQNKKNNEKTVGIFKEKISNRKVFER